MKNNKKKGFTLVELVVVIAVIAILAGVLIGTFTSVINRANQSKAVQEWKAAVDEAYVEYVAENHTIPTSIFTSNSACSFTAFTGATEQTLSITTYVLNSASPKRAEIENTYNTFVVLDEENKVYFIWNTDGTYAVVGTDGTLGTSSAVSLNYTDKSGESTPTDDVLSDAVTLKTLTYDGKTYYGTVVTP